MPRRTVLSASAVINALKVAGPAGLTPDAFQQALPGVSRSTLTRRLAALIGAGQVRAQGQGRATRYVLAAPHSIEDVRRYLAQDWLARPIARFREELLEATPVLPSDAAARLTRLNALARPLDARFLSDFLIDFSWASSLLEGSTYSAIDTQALIEYGQRNPDKPIEDALLIVNHKNAIQHLWRHTELSAANLCAIQALLTDRHGQPEAEASDHFLPDAQRGVPREFEELRLARSAYSPPYRPGTRYVAKALDRIVETARNLEPTQAAFYLTTRIPYLQAFANGNKRTSRLAANLPLLAAGLLPLSFVDFDKAEYIAGMAAFYELGDTQLLEGVFIDGYVRSIVRGSDIPLAVRAAGFDVAAVAAELTRYVRAGRVPQGVPAALFIGTTPAKKQTG